MSERKVLTKYYPPDFDPSALTRTRKAKDAGPRVQTVRLMAPFSMRCMTCGEYIYRGKKFNARKETPDERYLSIQIFRFYIRCPRCSGEIVFKTDPKNQDYVVERGAKRNTEPWRAGRDGELNETDDARLERLERERAEAEADEAGDRDRDAMAELEASKADAKERMAVADQLEEMRYRNARIERAHRDGVDLEVPVPVNEQRAREEEEDAAAARRAFAFARQQAALEEAPIPEEDETGGEASTLAGTGEGLVPGPSAPVATTSTAPVVAAAAKEELAPVPNFKRQVKKKKDHASLLGIKKKAPLV